MTAFFADMLLNPLNILDFMEILRLMMENQPQFLNKFNQVQLTEVMLFGIELENLQKISLNAC